MYVCVCMYGCVCMRQNEFINSNLQRPGIKHNSKCTRRGLEAWSVAGVLIYKLFSYVILLCLPCFALLRFTSLALLVLLCFALLCFTLGCFALIALLALLCLAIGAQLEDYWETTRRLLEDYWVDYWETIGRLLGDYWETIGRLLGDYWETTRESSILAIHLGDY